MAGEALNRIGTGESARGSDLYEPLIGSWSITSTWYDPDGTERSRPGEWHFERILGGLGVQDVLFSTGAAAHEYGTTVRTYDPAEDVWHVVWMQPGGGEFVAQKARGAGRDIVQEGRPLNESGGRAQRWRFIDITESSFTWLGESSDDGQEWRLDQRLDGRRVQPRPSSPLG